MSRLRDRKAGLPGAANNRLKHLRGLFAWKNEGNPDAIDPTKGIAKIAAASKDGFHPWSLAEVAKYEAHHPVGTRPRLALDLALYTTARKSDVVALGPRNVGDDGWLTFTQAKTKRPVELPIIDPLAESIAATETGENTFLVTGYGKSYSANGFGNSFREWCDDAGLPHCSIHGVRKATAARLAELGCSEEEIQSITGHTTGKEVSRYTRSARHRLMAASAMQKLSDSLRRKGGTNDAVNPGISRDANVPLMQLTD